MRTVKNRKRKFALGMKIAAMFSCIAIASVGFAAWIIVSKPEDQIATGTITADTVSDRGLELTAVALAADTEVETMDKALVFGKSTDEIANPWLDATTVPEENTRATLRVKYVATDITTATISVNFKGYVKSDGQPETAGLNRLNALVGQSATASTTNYVTFSVSVWSTDPALGGDPVDTKTFTNGSIGAATLTLSNLNVQPNGYFWVTVDFTWGQVFGGLNPFKYYNTGKTAEDYKDTAKAALAHLYNTLYNVDDMAANEDPNDDLTYKVVVSADSSELTPAA